MKLVAFALCFAAAVAKSEPGPPEAKNLIPELPTDTAEESEEPKAAAASGESAKSALKTQLSCMRQMKAFKKRMCDAKKDLKELLTKVDTQKERDDLKRIFQEQKEAMFRDNFVSEECIPFLKTRLIRKAERKLADPEDKARIADQVHRATTMLQLRTSRVAVEICRDIREKSAASSSVSAAEVVEEPEMVEGASEAGGVGEGVAAEVAAAPEPVPAQAKPFVISSRALPVLPRKPLPAGKPKPQALGPPLGMHKVQAEVIVAELKSLSSEEPVSEFKVPREEAEEEVIPEVELEEEKAEEAAEAKAEAEQEVAAAELPTDEAKPEEEAPAAEKDESSAAEEALVSTTEEPISSPAPEDDTSAEDLTEGEQIVAGAAASILRR